MYAVVIKDSDEYDVKIRLTENGARKCLRSEWERNVKRKKKSDYYNSSMTWIHPCLTYAQIVCETSIEYTVVKVSLF